MAGSRDLVGWLRAGALLLLAVFFVFAGVNHFRDPDFYLAMMPPYLPLHLELVYVSGVFEILGGIGVLWAKTRRWAGWGLIALLVAVFPANLHMALNPELFPDFGATAAYVRLPFQALFIAWVWWVALSDGPSTARPDPRSPESA